MRRFHFLLVILILSSCQTPAEQLASGMDDYFRKLIPENGPGGAALILKDTTVVYSGAFGLADLGTKAPITTQTLFNVGSITKTFVSYGILMLRAEGKLSLEDSLLKYFPEFKNKEIARKVKIKHLLTHTSGLPDIRKVKEDSVFYLTADDKQNWFPITQTDSLEFEPGTKYNYSNPAFNALALIIEQVSGQKWQAFINERIFRTSGMTTSTITDGAHPSTGVSHAYTKIRGQWTEDDFGEEPTFCASGNGGIWSSVEELARYELAIRKAIFLPSGIIDESAEVKTFPGWAGVNPPDRGWSWVIDKTQEGLKCINHTGHQGGFAAYYLSVPEKKVFAVVLYNAPYDVDDFRSYTFGLLQKVHWLD